MQYPSLSKIASILSCTLFFACNGPNQNNSDSESEQKNESYSNTDSLPVDDSPIWSYDYNADTLIRLDSNRSNPLTAAEAINIINKTYQGKVTLTLVGQDADTIKVKIEHPEVLTQQMGSTGAQAYIALATFTMTEQIGVNYVTFDFKEGDHASPGTYSRYSFGNHR